MTDVSGVREPGEGRLRERSEDTRAGARLEPRSADLGGEGGRRLTDPRALSPDTLEEPLQAPVGRIAHDRVTPRDAPDLAEDGPPRGGLEVVEEPHAENALEGAV